MKARTLPVVLLRCWSETNTVNSSLSLRISLSCDSRKYGCTSKQRWLSAEEICIHVVIQKCVIHALKNFDWYIFWARLSLRYISCTKGGKHPIHEANTLRVGQNSSLKATKYNRAQRHLEKGIEVSTKHDTNIPNSHVVRILELRLCTGDLQSSASTRNAPVEGLTRGNRNNCDDTTAMCLFYTNHKQWSYSLRRQEQQELKSLTPETPQK